MRLPLPDLVWAELIGRLAEVACEPLDRADLGACCF